MKKHVEFFNKWFGLVLTIAMTIREVFIWDKDSWWFLSIIWMIEIVAVLQPWNREKWDGLAEKTRKANEIKIAPDKWSDPYNPNVWA